MLEEERSLSKPVRGSEGRVSDAVMRPSKIVVTIEYPDGDRTTLESTEFQDILFCIEEEGWLMDFLRNNKVIRSSDEPRRDFLFRIKDIRKHLVRLDEHAAEQPASQPKG